MDSGNGGHATPVSHSVTGLLSRSRYSNRTVNDSNKTVHCFYKITSSLNTLSEFASPQISHK